MLTACLLAAVVVSTASAAGRRPSPLYALALASDGRGPQIDLLRLGAKTLAESGRVRVGRDSCAGTFAARAESPDHARLAVSDGCGGVISIFDLPRMQMTGQVYVWPYSSNIPRTLTWPGRHALLVGAVSSGDIVEARFARIDPATATVIAKWEPRGWVWQADISGANGEARTFGGKVAALTTPEYTYGVSQRNLGAPLWVQVLGESGPLLSLNSGLRMGVENWQVTPTSRLPPGASKAASLVREDFARTKGTPVAEVQVLRVTPFRYGLSPGSNYGYATTVVGRGQYARYESRYPFDAAGFVSPLVGPPDPSENDILHAANGTWEVADAALVGESTGSRAFVITSGAVFAEIDLTRMTIRYHPLSRSLGLSVQRPALVAGRKVFIPASSTMGSSDHVLLLDVRTNRLREVVPRGGRIEPAGSRILLYSGGIDGQSGVSLVDAAGRRRYTILEGKSIRRVQARGPLAYITIEDQGQTETAVVEIKSGRVLRTVFFSQTTELLAGRSGQ